MFILFNIDNIKTNTVYTNKLHIFIQMVILGIIIEYYKYLVFEYILYGYFIWDAL